MQAVIPVMQTDQDRKLTFDLYMDGIAYDPLLDLGVQTDVDLFRIDYLLPNGTKGSYDTVHSGQAYHVQQTRINVVLKQEMLALPGKVIMNIVMQLERVRGNLELRAFPVILDVCPAAVPSTLQ